MSKIYIGSTLSWDWRGDWLNYVAFAKKIGCRFDTPHKRWTIPNFSTSVELVRFCLASGESPHHLIVRDFDSGERVAAEDYIAPDYNRKRRNLGTRLPLQCTIEGKTVYLSVPLDDNGEVNIDHETLYGLAKVGCKGEWIPDRGFWLKENVDEAVDFIIRTKACPIVGAPHIYETPFLVDTYEGVYPHQRDGVRYLYHRRTALLCDDMGLGKTMQSIIAAEALRLEARARALLIICPVSLVGNWENELLQWETGFTDINIVPYSQLKRLKEIEARFPGGDGLVAIADEAHYLKSPSSQRTKHFIKFALSMPKLSALWLMTGTPVTRDFSNLWPLAYVIRHPLSDAYAPTGMMKIPNASILRISGSMGTHMLMRKKTDLLTLPPKIQKVFQVDTGLEKMFDLKMAEMLLTGRDEDAMEHLMVMKRLTAEAKVDDTVALAREILTQGRKVVVFTDHTKPFDRIVAALGSQGVLSLDGRTKASTRTGLVERFQKDPSCRAFIGNIRAAGVGITLTAASDVIFNDFTWLPADMQQAEDRCHRIGATGECVMIKYVTDCNLPLDELLCTKLSERSAEIATFEQHSQNILSELREWARAKIRASRK